MNKQLKKIALCLREDSFYVREVLEGIHAYAIGSKGWTFRFFPLEEVSFPMINAWQPDALLVNVHTEELCQKLIALNIPVVNVNNIFMNPVIPWIGADDKEIGKTGADHLLSLGLRNYAFLGYSNWKYSLEREAGFIGRVKEAGYSCAVKHQLNPVELVDAAESWILVEEDVADWVNQLPKPVGIMACNDTLGEQVTNICRESEIEVPDMVSILGVDNDPLLCDFSYPPLSSVDLPLRKLGYEAGQVLEDMLNDKKFSSEGIKIPPKPVCVRQSTQFNNAEDIVVKTVLNQLNELYTEPITIEEIIERVNISRRKVERRFKEVLGITPHNALKKLRIEKAEWLIANTDMLMSRVAEISGFGETKNLSKVFRQVKGITPTNYRKQYHLD